ncbi:peptide ABC transporter substrate-binding protein [Methylobacterium organophilum]|uniref:peptide ABC transporter substrate-binding protein n=1 Tax=Methylobacterium organophilum TaxID=410 RepID=UPI001F135C96|nr:peptide ABC transporter substrate-binding protein [Methylobacterium organophilum]UMY16954.1 peptide ABC transporter substrate-binding protein [Methylobacterium organophilum]
MGLDRRRLLAGAACWPALPRAAGAASTTLYRRGNDADPETLDPHKSSTVAEAHLLRDLYEGLLTYDNLGRIVPGAAERWTVSEDRLTYTFRLRADGRWSNGDPVVAEDFVFALRRILAPATGAKYAEVLYPLLEAPAVNRGEKPVEALGVAAPDPATVVVRLGEPVPYLLELLTHQTTLPVHRPSLARYGDAFTRPGNLVSNGPYALRDMVPNDRITLVANPHHRDAGALAIREVAFIPTPDLGAAVRRYAAGEIDSLSDLPGDQMASLKRRFGDAVKLGPALGVLSIAVNTRKKPFDDPRVRRALSLVIDREFLAEAVWGETMDPAYSLCPPGLDHYRTPPELPGRETLPIDREEEARRLLAEAGFGERNPLDLEYRFNVTDNNRNTAVALADFWRGLGIRTRFTATDAKTHFAYLRDGGDFDLARISWYADYSDPQNFLFLLRTGNDGLNPGRWSNADYDRLLAEGAAERDVGRRADLLFAAERIALAELPWIPLLHYRSKALIPARLHGFHQNLRNAAPTRYLSLTP